MLVMLSLQYVAPSKAKLSAPQKVEVEVIEKVTEDKNKDKILLKNNAKFDITIEGYKRFIQDMIDMVNGLDKFGEKYEINLEDSIPDIDNYINGGGFPDASIIGATKLKMKQVSNTKIKVKVSETVDRDSLDQYKEKINCCSK